MTPARLFLLPILILAAACHRTADSDGSGVVGPPATDGVDLEIAPNFAWVSWDTTDVLQGCVQWGPTDSYGDEACEPSTGLDHRVLMSSLDPLQTYHYRIGFKGPEGRVFGKDRTFQTLSQEPIYSDDFNYSNLDRGLWSLVDPLGLGTLEMEGDEPGLAGVRLTSPAWVDYGVDGEDRSLRLMQDVGPGDFVNVVELTAAIDCPGESCGTVWAADDEHYVRFGLDYYNGDVYLVGVASEDGVPLESDAILVNFGAWFADFSLHVRVQKQAQGWLADWSYDGLIWHPGIELQHPLEVQRGGLYVSNGEGFAAGVSLLVNSFFDASFPIVPQDQSLRVDRTAPYIYRLSPEVLSETALRLQWFTDEPCDGGLDWGQAPHFDFYEAVEGLAYNQQVTLEDLEEHTHYVLRARARDMDGRESVSEELELETEDD